MKNIASISTILLGLALSACGGAQPEPTSQLQQRPTKQLEAPADDDKASATPTIDIPPGPPPKRLIVRELKKGSGKVAVRGDLLWARFVAYDYKTKDVYYDFWNANPVYSFILGNGTVRKGLEIGLKGIRAGGRRELIMPSRLAYGKGALAFVFELIKIGGSEPQSGA